jgi:hypothetical protein
MHRLRVPYDDFPDVSKDFVNETSFRMRSACRAIEILAEYKAKIPKTEIEYHQFKSIRYVMARFAVLEICAIFDKHGRWSLMLNKNQRGKYRVQPARLKKIFPLLPVDQLEKLQSNLDYVVRKNSALIDRLLHTRHNRIAHAGRLNTKFDPLSLISVRFPKARCEKLASQIDAILMETTFGLKLPWR